MLNREKHESKMIDVLSDIFRNKNLSSRLGFKGGTACYLLEDLPRFSVDLDFNIIGKTTSNKINDIFEELKNVLSTHGKLDEARIKHFTVFFLLNYEDHQHNLKIEVSKRPAEDTYELKNFLGIRMPMMTRPDMFAHKLVALMDRKQLANRDLFDIHWMLYQKWDVNENIIETSTGYNLVTYLEKVLTFIDKKVSSRSLLDGLGELLDEKQKYWVKNKMVDDLKVLIERKIYLSKKRNL